MKELYVVSQEWCDKGWNHGDQVFVSAIECMKHMRDYVAQHIMYLRNNGYKVDLLHCWKNNGLPCGCITFRTTKDFKYEYWEFRVTTFYLWESNEEYRKGQWPWNM